MAKGKSNKGGSRVRHDKPIGVKGTVDELPPRSHSSAVTEILNQIIEHKGSWVQLDPAGRQPNSVQSMVTSAAKKQKLDIDVSVRGDEIYARAN